jgi:hypothetical protein
LIAPAAEGKITLADLLSPPTNSYNTFL